MTAMTPLMTLLVLGLLLVVVLALLVWSLVGTGWTRRPVAERAASGRRTVAAGAASARGDTRRARPTQPSAPGGAASAADDEHPFRVVAAPQRSNDEHRGAKAARPAPTRPNDDDPFERFLRAGRDDER